MTPHPSPARSALTALTALPVLPALAAAAVGFCALGAYVLAWDLFVTQSSCQVVRIGDCTGAPIAMALVGLPVLYVVWAVGLWATGARFVGLAPLVLGVLLFAVARMLGPYDTPVLLWLSLAAALSAGWRLRFGAVRTRPPLVSPGR